MDESYAGYSQIHVYESGILAHLALLTPRSTGFRCIRISLSRVWWEWWAEPRVISTPSWGRRNSLWIPGFCTRSTAISKNTVQCKNIEVAQPSVVQSASCWKWICLIILHDRPFVCLSVCHNFLIIMREVTLLSPSTFSYKDLQSLNRGLLSILPQVHFSYVYCSYFIRIIIVFLIVKVCATLIYCPIVMVYSCVVCVWLNKLVIQS